MLEGTRTDYYRAGAGRPVDSDTLRHSVKRNFERVKTGNSAVGSGNQLSSKRIRGVLHGRPVRKGGDGAEGRE